MKKYLLVLAGLYCVLSYALAEHPDYPELKKSDANIIGHVLDKKTKEHLPYITIALKGPVFVPMVLLSCLMVISGHHSHL